MIIAIDPAASTGIAYKRPGKAPKTIAISCKPDDPDPLSMQPSLLLRDWLTAFHSSSEVDKVGIEWPFAKGTAAFRLDSMFYGVLLWCGENDVAWQRIPIATWKAHAGHGHMKPQQYWDAAKKKWPRLPLRTVDEAAALWMLDFMESQ